MEPIEHLAERAARAGVPPSRLLRSELGRHLLQIVGLTRGLVLQGGGALHHVYGSPRYSADLDFVQAPDFDEVRFAAALERFRESVRAAWGSAEIEGPISKDKLHRHKVRVTTGLSSFLVLALERYEIRVHRPVLRTLAGDDPATAPRIAVEAPAEILADKVAASLDRWRARGSIKLRDLYDLDRLLDLEPPDRPLIEAKLADYGLPFDNAALAGIAASLGPLSADVLREQLRGVLPEPDLESLDLARILFRARTLLEDLAR
ncbi:MAG: nucleotidyl transferase AbiEii/AbiGii toxin family protein [Planctomycetes bacterium]|nr:nucleotidyl transferase AbiEii/AbiGii toxin family protein [Planctomycetota bacterium]